MPPRVRITVTGVVQGVGFRPYVYRLATGMGLCGYVLNSTGGVVIEVEGERAGKFADELIKEPPPLSGIESVDSVQLEPEGCNSFEIRLSEDSEAGFSLISPDIATCPDCLAELFNPSDRHYRYPFINCTNCGPRYSIVRGVPYDRPLTTMSAFEMCKDCRREYDDPSDRRFHAQPAACPACGPSLEFIGETGAPEGAGPLGLAVTALREGQVVAVKGLGGFHLACDAANHAVVKRLRETKRGSRKPFALMAPDVDTIRRFCRVDAQDEMLLTGRKRPVVLLDKISDEDGPLSPEVAPGIDTLGFMLPYTPLHHLLMRGPDGSPNFDALVMTSGNLADEPIVTDNREATVKLSGLADSFLVHDRDIFMRVDDSVARVAGGLPRLVRRARGYVPEAIDMGREIPEILACGAELKSTLTVTRGRYAIVSQYIGELTSFETMGFYAETLGNLMKIYGVNPSVVACDMHPDYLSTRFAYEYSIEGGTSPERIAVQHHHAHIASCMAENGCRDDVIGVAFDGTGYGTDGKTWGSEFLIVGMTGFERFAHLDYLPLPGGDAAVREPWRAALSALVSAYGPEEGWRVFIRVNGAASSSRAAEVALKMLEKGINSPHSCGMGRLFDAVSSLAGVLDAVSYEAEAAILLESEALRAADEAGVYRYAISDDTPRVIDWRPLVRDVVDDVLAGVSKPVTAARFHNTICAMTLDVCRHAGSLTGLDTVALSGGVFQNRLLFTKVEEGLRSAGFRVLTHSKLPANDGCVSLGQAAVAAAIMASG